MTPEEIQKLTNFFRTKFQNQGISVRGRPQKDDSAEVYLGDEFIGVLFRDDEDPDEEEIDELIGVGKDCKEYTWRDCRRDEDEPVRDSRRINAVLKEFGPEFEPISCSFPNPKMPHMPPRSSG